MKILKQVGILFGLCWISMYIERLLPITFPSSVIALILLLILLLVRVIKVDHVREKSDFLLGNEAVICGLTPEKPRNIKEFAV